MAAQRIPTVADVRADPRYWIAGPGRDVASRTRCPHDYFLTDSCPGCDHDAEQEARAAGFAEGDQVVISYAAEGNNGGMVGTVERPADNEGMVRVRIVINRYIPAEHLTLIPEGD